MEYSTVVSLAPGWNPHPDRGVLGPLPLCALPHLGLGFCICKVGLYCLQPQGCSKGPWAKSRALWTCFHPAVLPEMPTACWALCWASRGREETVQPGADIGHAGTGRGPEAGGTTRGALSIGGAAPSQWSGPAGRKG